MKINTCLFHVWYGNNQNFIRIQTSIYLRQDEDKAWISFATSRINKKTVLKTSPICFCRQFRSNISYSGKIKDYFIILPGLFWGVLLLLFPIIWNSHDMWISFVELFIFYFAFTDAIVFLLFSACFLEPNFRIDPLMKSLLVDSSVILQRRTYPTKVSRSVLLRRSTCPEWNSKSIACFLRSF